VFLVVLAAFLALGVPVRLHADEYPPDISVNGNPWGGGGGSYNGQLNWQGNTINASIFISAGTATLSGTAWMDGYWTSDPAYWDDVDQVWVQPPSYYINGGYYPFSVSGTYSDGNFSIPGVDVSATDGAGNQWSPPDDSGSGPGTGGTGTSPTPPTNPPFDTNYVAGGPPALLVNGTKFCHVGAGTAGTSYAVDIYYSADYSTSVGLGTNGSSVPSGGSIPYWGNYGNGTYTPNAGGGVFVPTNYTVDLRPLASDGSQMITTTVPTYGPPKVAVNGQTWTFRGTVGAADYYLGNITGQNLQISSTLGVTLNDPTAGVSNTIGYYNAGIFQDLGEPALPLKADGTVLSSIPNQGPASVIINGVAWYHSSAGGTAYDAYYGTQSNQVLDIVGGTVWVSDPYNNINTTGTYANGVFQMLGTGVVVQAGDSGGSPAATSPQNRTQNVADSSTINGSLDVYGNLFSLGTWQGSSTTAGLSLSFTDQPPGSTGAASTISLVANRPSNQWMWSHANSDLSSTMPMMKLDQANRLMLFSTADGSPQIVLDPQGSTSFNGAVSLQGRVRLQPQGDVTMGAFTNEPSQ